MDRDANAAFYGSASITPEQIFTSSGNAAPQAANLFVQKLTAQTRRLPAQPGMETGITANNEEPGSTSEPSVRTYGIGDPDAPDADEDVFSEEF